MLSQIFVCLLLEHALFTWWADATLTEKITQTFQWDGVAAYVPVDRQVIQQKLDTWHESISNECDGPKLYLPTSSVFPDILDENQHVVYIDAGHGKFYDFQDLSDKCISINGIEFAVIIPLLTDDPNGIPHYSLALGKFYERGRGDIPKHNIVFPYIPIDEITMNDTIVIMRNGSDEIKFSMQRFLNPCKPTKPVVRHEFDKFVEQDFQIGAPKPNFAFCDRHPIANHFCTTTQSIKCDFHRASPNICQSSWKTPGRVSCETPLRIINVTKGFRDFMLFGDGEVEVIASESFFGNFSIGLKYPCIE